MVKLFVEETAIKIDHLFKNILYSHIPKFYTVLHIFTGKDCTARIQSAGNNDAIPK